MMYEAYKQALKLCPGWLCPSKDKTYIQLVSCFVHSELPSLIIRGPDGEILHRNAAELIEEHGVQASPFTPEKLEQLEEIVKAKLEAQTLKKSILVQGDPDFVIRKDETKVQHKISNPTTGHRFELLY